MDPQTLAASGEAWVLEGVKTEVVPTGVLVSNIQALLGLSALREARLQFGGCRQHGRCSSPLLN